MPNAKAILSLGFTKYVLDLDKAVLLMEALHGAEKYEEVYRPVAEGGSTQHIYMEENAAAFTLCLMNESLYRMAKLAGKPVKN